MRRALGLLLFALLVGMNDWSKQNLGFGSIDAPQKLGYDFSKSLMRFSGP